MSLFKTKDYSKPEPIVTAYGGGKKQSEENEEIKDRIIRDIRTLFEPEEKDNYKPIIVGNFQNNRYTEYESSGDRNKNLSVKEYLDKIKPYLTDIIINLQKCDTQEIHLTGAISFTSSKDVVEERVMHSKSSNIKFVI